MKGKYTTLKVVIDKIMRHPMMTSITEESIIDYTIDFIQILGIPNIYMDKEAIVDINNHRGELPCDFINITEVKDLKCNSIIPSKINKCSNIDNSYQIKGNYIYTTSKDNQLLIFYKAIEIDEDGMPLIPDYPSFTRALEAYIKKQYFTILFDLGKLQGQILQNAQQEYAWAVGSCSNDFLNLTPEELDVEVKQLKTLI